jgi:magnesium transporter
LLQVYRNTGAFLTSHSTELPGEIIWIDLLNPTADERAFVESRSKVRIPSRPPVGLPQMNMRST